MRNILILLNLCKCLPVQQTTEKTREIILTVKTTEKYHDTRLKLLFETWTKEALQNVRNKLKNRHKIS